LLAVMTKPSWFWTRLYRGWFGGYTRVDAGSGGDSNVWYIGLRFYTGPQGTTLVQHHRTGTLGSIGSISGLQHAFLADQNWSSRTGRLTAQPLSLPPKAGLFQHSLSVCRKPFSLLA